VPVIYKNTFNSRFITVCLSTYSRALPTTISRGSDNTEITNLQYLLESGEGIANYVTLPTRSGTASDTMTARREDRDLDIIPSATWNVGYHPVPQRKGYIFMGWYDEAAG
jgi:hypothetical protein